MKAILAETERVYSLLNKSLFANSLRKPVFSISPFKKGVVRFIPEQFELVIGSDIAKVDDDAFLLHLLHEMVHVANFQKGVVDCRHGQYHNAKFREAALAVGFAVGRDRSHGWGLTYVNMTVLGGSVNGADLRQPSAEINLRREVAFVQAKIDEKVLKDVQKKIVVSRKRTFFLKYECGCPPLIIASVVVDDQMGTTH